MYAFRSVALWWLADIKTWFWICDIQCVEYIFLGSKFTSVPSENLVSPTTVAKRVASTFWVYVTHCILSLCLRILYKIPWTEEPSRLQSIGSQRFRHDWAYTYEQNINVHEQNINVHAQNVCEPRCIPLCAHRPMWHFGDAHGYVLIITL